MTPSASDDSPRTTANGVGDRPTRAPGTPILPWVLAAGCALLAVMFGVRFIALRSEVATLRTERDLAETAHQMAAAQLGERTLVAEKMINQLGARLSRAESLSRLKVTKLHSLLANVREANAVVVWDPEQQSGLLVVEKLPAVAREQDYQVWIIDPHHPAPVGGPVFKPDSTGKATISLSAAKPITQATAFLITLEPSGGVPEPAGPHILRGQL